MATNSVLVRTLYRALLRSAKPFSSPSPNAAAVSCLLHRTGIDDHRQWEAVLDSPRPLRVFSRHEKSKEEARDLSRSYYEDQVEPEPCHFEQDLRDPSHFYFRGLLRECIAGKHGIKQMQIPSDMDTTRLLAIIKREFRLSESPYDNKIRQQVGFVALRELNKKLAWYDTLSKQQQGDVKSESPEKITKRNRRQAARNVSPLPANDPKSYLKAGTYLVAHPHLNGFFRRTVICILEHSQGDKGRGGTYGLIVNRIAVSPENGKRRTLADVLREPLPPDLMRAFGNCSFREGGPIHMSLQMIHARTPQQPALGGTVLNMVTGDNESAAIDTDRAVYYQGNMMDAADAVNSGSLDRDDVSFYFGASGWESGQLEGEINKGYFIPCRGPPEIALTGVCERVGDDNDDKCRKRPVADLWLSMMCAIGEQEANLAHLVNHDDGKSPNGEACDTF